MAEVAAGFAGFTAILLAVFSRETPLQAMRVGIVHFLQLSLGVVLIALLPSVLSSMAYAEDAIWRIANAVQGFYHYYILWWILSRRGTSLGHSKMGGALTAVLGIIGLSIASLNVCAAAGFFPDLLVFAFLFGLLWYLAMALVNFVYILLYRLDLQ